MNLSAAMNNLRSFWSKLQSRDFWLNLRKREVWFPWVGVIIGSFVMSAGFVLFTNPYKIVPGGVYGLGRAFHYLVPSIQTGTFGLMMDIPLLITGLLVFGGNFGVKTVTAAITVPLFINGLTDLLGEDPFDGICFISQYLNLSNDILLASIFGGVLIGAGVGIIVKFDATSGGTDVVSMLVSRFMHMKFASAMFIVESIVVLVGMLILRDWTMPLYALVCIFAQSKVTDFVLSGSTSNNKLLFIITQKNDEMRDYVINDLDRSGTYIKAKGMYTGNDTEMLFIVVSERQISGVRDKIKEVDPKAFVVIVNTQDTFGEGFQEFPK